MLTLTTQSQHRTHVLGNWPARLIPLPKPSHDLYFWLTRSRLEFVPTTPFQVPLFVKMAHRTQERTYSYIGLLLSFSRSVVSNSLQPHGLQHARLFCPSTISEFAQLMSIKAVMPSKHLILCRPLLLLPSIFPSIRVFSNESTLCIRWPKYWSFSISPSNEYLGLISFRTDWFMTKDMNEEPDEEVCRVMSGRVLRWGASVPTGLVCITPHPWMCSQTQKFPKSHSLGIF